MVLLLGRLLGGFGALTALLATALSIFAPEATGGRYLAAAALVGITGWIYLDWDAILRGFRSRGGVEQLISWLLLATVTVLCGLLLHLSERQTRRWDLSEDRSNSLRSETAELLRRLPAGEELRVQAFYTGLGDGRQEGQRARFKRLMDAVRAETQVLHFELIDPDENPYRAEQAGVHRNAQVLLSRGDRTERLHDPDEGDLANALLRLLSEQRPGIALLRGHGELSSGEIGDGGFVIASGRLTELGYAVTSVDLRTGAMPEDAALLIIPGPQAALLEGEVAAVIAFVEQGGSLLLALDPKIVSGLETQLDQWGLLARPDIIVDPLMRSVVGDPTVPVSAEFGFHEITSGLRVPLILPTARSVGEVEQDPERVRILPLALTSPSAWGETDLDAEVAEQGDTDAPGPLWLAAIAELRSAEGQPAGKVLLVGDSDWCSDSFAGQLGNGDFLARAVGFLTEQEDVVTLPAPERSSQPMDLDFLRELLLILAALIVAPGAAAVGGVAVYFWRKNL